MGRIEEGNEIGSDFEENYANAYLIDCESRQRGRSLNLAVLFLSDIGTQSRWTFALAEEVAEEARDREIDLLHASKRSPDLVLRLPEGTKIWEARVNFENAWRETTGQSVSFVTRSGRDVALACLRGLQLTESQKSLARGNSPGLVFLETRGIEAQLDAERERLRKSLGEVGCSDLVTMLQMSRGEVFVMKRGKENERPPFARAARIVQECYRPIVEKSIHAAGRGLKSSLKEIQGVIETHAPRILASGTSRSERGE